MALEQFSGWTFYSPCEIPSDIPSILAASEKPICAFKTVRDAAVFTSHRLIIRDSQGLTGKKVEIYSLPYSSINMWSTENAGKLLDVNAELELWTRAGHFKINIGPKVDIRALDRLIADCVLR